MIVVVTAAEAAVAAHRAHLDRSAGWGVPAHVTVLYPFVPPALVDDTLVGRLTAAVATVPAFDCDFAATEWFDQDAVFLAPYPDEPFRDLTAAVHAAFPDYPPYGGAHGEPTPHLTIGQIECGTVDQLRAAEAAVKPLLPIRTRITGAVLIQGAHVPDGWTTRARLPLS